VDYVPLSRQTLVARGEKERMVKDGYKFAAPPLLLGAFFLAWHTYWLGVALILVGLFVLFFFRDPERTPPTDPNTIVSPADGRVMEIVEEQFAGRPGVRISVFLSIFDVHVNRSPVAGRITSIEYRKGKFHAAMRGKASDVNEQNVFHVLTDRGEVVFKQIAGWIARRIVCWKSPGDSVVRGERIGMIRFGSRMDLWLPEGVEVLVQTGQHVAAGSSALARWK
jgi:phosphatidylserine decarboxylase